jgi:hypothetical protein
VGVPDLAALTPCYADVIGPRQRRLVPLATLRTSVHWPGLNIDLAVNLYPSTRRSP